MRRLHLPGSTSHYILTRLERNGYLSRHPETKRYEIGLKLIAIAHSALRDAGLRAVAEPVLHRLAEQTRSGAFVGVLERKGVMIVGKVEQPGVLKMDMEIGVRYPAQRTALGKVLLASLLAPRLIQMFWNTPARNKSQEHNADDFLAQLREIKRRGYGTNDGELFSGIRAVAAPIRDPDGNVRAAVSATGPLFKIDDQVVIAAVKAAARDISHRLSSQVWD